MSKSNKLLLFFTGSYPFGRQEAFIENEIGYLAAAFDRVIVFPQTRSQTLRPVPSNVEVFPLPEYGGWRKGLLLLWNACRSRIFWNALSEIRDGNDPLYRLRMLISYVGLAEIYRNAVINRVSSDAERGCDIYLYSYWLDRNALAMVMLKERVRARNVVSRVHGFDVYEERNPDAYLPLRKEILKGLDAVHSISTDASEYLKNKYPGLTKYFVFRLGTERGAWVGRRSSKGLHFISVSNVIPLKRVALIARSIHAFARLSPETPIRWTHFGDGALFDELKDLVAGFSSSNLTVDLRGGQLNAVVKAFYEATPLDLFINLSESEGIPVSFMEAMSYGVPVLATNVGGVGEIIDSNCGYILPADVSFEQVAERIRDIANDRAQLDEVSLQALRVWTEKFSADVAYPKFCNALMGEAG